MDSQALTASLSRGSFAPTSYPHSLHHDRVRPCFCRRRRRKSGLPSNPSSSTRHCPPSRRRPCSSFVASNLTPTNSDNLSWGRLSPQLTPTPSPPSSLLVLDNVNHVEKAVASRSKDSVTFARPPATLSVSSSLSKAPRSPNVKITKRTSARRTHTQASSTGQDMILIRSRASMAHALERQFWEPDASGRRARRVTEP